MKEFMATICSQERAEELLEEGWVYVGLQVSNQLKKRRVQHYICHRLKPGCDNDWIEVYLAKQSSLDYLEMIKNEKCGRCEKMLWKSKEGCEASLTEFKIKKQQRGEETQVEAVKCKVCKYYRWTSQPINNYTELNVTLICSNYLIGRKTLKGIQVSNHKNSFDQGMSKFIPKKFCVRETNVFHVFKIPDRIWRLDYASSKFLEGAEEKYALLSTTQERIKGKLKI